MKLCSPSNGCETRPVKSDPPTPVASLAASAVTKTPMRRHASEWAVGFTATKQRSFWVPRALCSLKVERPRFSWTRIKGESNVQGGGENGSVEGRGTGRGIGATGVRADDAAAGAGSLAPGQRWSASRKRDVVLRLLRGESLEALSREVGVEIYRLEEWRERAMAGLELGLKDRHGEPVAEVLDAAKRHIGELSMEIDLLRERARAAEQRLPLAMRRSRR